MCSDMYRDSKSTELTVNSDECIQVEPRPAWGNGIEPGIPRQIGHHTDPKRTGFDVAEHLQDGVIITLNSEEDRHQESTRS
jgi:hypothetical protein